ncbi:uncharacterized protein LOC141583646 [Saimiri boliviensis]|uniref:uncharacterized protein LOC141583646 n=1 Tax=Saimiri boliviensis TaxID=27679 RepID=UPI003D77AC24
MLISAAGMRDGLVPEHPAMRGGAGRGLQPRNSDPVPGPARCYSLSLRMSLDQDSRRRVGWRGALAAATAGAGERACSPAHCEHIWGKVSLWVLPSLSVRLRGSEPGRSSGVWPPPAAFVPLAPDGEGQPQRASGVGAPPARSPNGRAAPSSAGQRGLRSPARLPPSRLSPARVPGSGVTGEAGGGAERAGEPPRSSRPSAASRPGPGSEPGRRPQTGSRALTKSAGGRGAARAAGRGGGRWRADPGRQAHLSFPPPRGAGGALGSRKGAAAQGRPLGPRRRIPAGEETVTVPSVNHFHSLPGMQRATWGGVLGPLVLWTHGERLEELRGGDPWRAL